MKTVQLNGVCGCLSWVTLLAMRWVRGKGMALFKGADRDSKWHVA